MPALVTLHRVARRYPSGTLAVQDLDLTIERGSFISLLGPSGCGKSTVLRMLAGLDAPSDGRIAWSADGAAPARCGFVFQDATLMPWLRVAANVALPLRLAGVARAEREQRAQAALESVGLGGFGGAWPHELSGGMRMRVSIARALVTQPDLLLFDEPFAALDEITRFALQDDLLAQWRARRFTAVFVTHSIGEAAWLSQRIVVMGARPGRVVSEQAVPWNAAADTHPAEPPPARHSPAFADLCASVSATLLNAMQATPPRAAVGASSVAPSRSPHA